MTDQNNFPTDTGLVTTNQTVLLTPTQDVQALRDLMRRLRDEVFVQGIDYGIIPGTGTKPVLLLPGMEKILRSMRLRPEYVLLESSIIDFDKPLFHFDYECRIFDVETNACIYTAIGSCNSREQKFRYRMAARTCPNCGKEAIIKGKQEYGGGWICFDKKGGCKAKFTDDDPRIVDQKVGRIENEDVADQVNTMQKIAQKRGLGSAIKGAANVSELYTVDLEDFQPDGTQPSVTTPATTTTTGDPLLNTDVARKAFFDEVKKRGMKTVDAAQHIKDAGQELVKLTHSQAIALLFPSVRDRVIVPEGTAPGQPTESPEDYDLPHGDYGGENEPQF